MPTATQHEFLDMCVTDVRRVRDSSRDYIVLLADPDGTRRLPIWIRRDEARPIALRLLQVDALPRPLTHYLAARMVDALGGGLREVRIDRLTDQTATRSSSWTAQRAPSRWTPAKRCPRLGARDRRADPGRPRHRGDGRGLGLCVVVACRHGQRGRGRPTGQESW